MKTTYRMVAAVVVSLTAFVFLGAVGLWGVALAAPALIFAPSAVRGAIADRKSKQALNAELELILGGSRGRG